MQLAPESNTRKQDGIPRGYVKKSERSKRKEGSASLEAPLFSSRKVSSQEQENWFSGISSIDI